MPGADPGKACIVGMAAGKDMTHFGVAETANSSAVDHQAAANPGPDRDIGAGALSLSRTPPTFREGSAVDIGIKAQRHAKCPDKGTRQIGVAPARLGRSGNMAPSGRGHVQFQRTKARNANGGQCAVALSRPGQPVDGAADGLGRASRRNALCLQNRARFRQEAEDELRPAALDAAE